MPSCELCGRKPSVYNCEVEGTMMNVCQDCAKYGKIKSSSNVRIVVQDSKRPTTNEPEYVFVQGYGILIKNAREKLNLNQEDFAKKINEHKSLIHQLESEHIKPSIVFARKLEKALHIKIVDEVKNDEKAENSNKSQPRLTSRPTASGPVTIGEMIKFKTKK